MQSAVELAGYHIAAADLPLDVTATVDGSRCCPPGTSWIDAPNMAPICRILGVDYAPALVGFEVQGGRMVPRIRGVVICQVSILVIVLHVNCGAATYR